MKPWKGLKLKPSTGWTPAPSIQEWNRQRAHFAGVKNETVDGLNFSLKHLGVKPSRAYFAGVPISNMRQNETVDGLNFIPKHLGMKPSKGSFRWCTNKQNAPKWNRWRVEFQAQAFRNETVKGLIFLCSVLFVRCRFFVCMVEFAVFLECVSLPQLALYALKLFICMCS